MDEKVTISYSQFAVGEKPYCVWEWDLPDRNMEYLDRVDPTYFDYVGRVNAEILGTDQEQHAAMAIRTAYHHGLETLFALMFAAIQAPDCVVGWMQRYRMEQLRSLVSSAKRLGGGKLRYAKVKPTEAGARPYTLKGIADMMVGGAWHGEEDAAKTRREFGLLWQRFAEDFLKEHNQDEYNSFKHGLRTSAGGFYLRLGPEETPIRVGPHPAVVHPELLKVRDDGKRKPGGPAVPPHLEGRRPAVLEVHRGLLRLDEEPPLAAQIKAIVRSLHRPLDPQGVLLDDLPLDERTLLGVVQVPTQG